MAEDADIEAAAAGLVDGACYNAGQSCCGIERVFVAQSKYEQFLERAQIHMEAYVLGDPMEDTTTLGPMALPHHTTHLKTHVDDAIAKGARVLTRTGESTDASGHGRFFLPTLVADCHNRMEVMQEESFGPILAVAPVASDEEALEKMNDCKYGLTAAVFTTNEARAMKLGRQLQAGTVYMNRCDALDPRLPWTGVGESGKGQSLSKYGFSAFTQLKSVRGLNLCFGRLTCR